MSKIKIILSNLALILVGMLFAVVLLEITLRILPNRWKYEGYRYVPDSDLGHWGAPLQIASSGGDCFNVFGITTNEFGMRDQPRTLEKSGYRVALFGDSLTEGLQVEDEYVVNQLLENRFHEIEFLNFAVSGYGPAQELIAYQSKARRFKPDLVMVLLWPGNDIRDSSLELRRNSGGTENVPLYFISESGERVLEPAKEVFKTGRLGRVIGWRAERLIKDHLFRATYRAFSYSFGLARLRMLEVTSSPTNNQSTTEKISWGPYTGWNVYRVPPNKAWVDGWRITEEILIEFKETVKEDGGEFVLVVLPTGNVDLVDDMATFMAEQGVEDVPSDFDPAYPHKRLQAFAEREEIPFLSLLPGFKSYAVEHGLKEPYFSHTCDGHWSQLGHEVETELIGNFLVERGFIPASADSQAQD